jgi:hypothetical protein
MRSAVADVAQRVVALRPPTTMRLKMRYQARSRVIAITGS